MKTTIYNKYLYELLESRVLINPSNLFPYEYSFTVVEQVNNTILGFMSSYIGQVSNVFDASDDAFLKALIMKYSNSIILESDTLYSNGIIPTTTSGISFEDKDFMRRWYLKLIYTYNRTKERYHTILNAYNDNKTKLLDEVKTITESRFHDTPQNEGYFGDLAHTTNINQVTSKSQVDTLMNRIKEIERGYSDVIDDWCNEFKNLFIEY